MFHLARKPFFTQPFGECRVDQVSRKCQISSEDSFLAVGCLFRENSSCIAGLFFVVPGWESDQSKRQDYIRDNTIRTTRCHIYLSRSRHNKISALSARSDFLLLLACCCRDQLCQCRDTAIQLHLLLNARTIPYLPRPGFEAF